jgi:hypothetical protein
MVDRSRACRRGRTFWALGLGILGGNSAGGHLRLFYLPVAGVYTNNHEWDFGHLGVKVSKRTCCTFLCDVVGHVKCTFNIDRRLLFVHLVKASTQYLSFKLDLSRVHLFVYMGR